MDPVDNGRPSFKQAVKHLRERAALRCDSSAQSVVWSIADVAAVWVVTDALREEQDEHRANQA